MTSFHSGDHYIAWRRSRIGKLEKIFGKEYFKGKRVLEVGAGFGLIGKTLHDTWDAEVVFTEAREHLVDTIRLMNPGAEVHTINHEEPWNLDQKFDFIIHWGLLYHLNNWKSDLNYTVKHLNSGGILSLESEILDRVGIMEEKIVEPSSYDDQAMNGMGTQMTADAVEDVLTRLGKKFVRYDDADLNADFHHYDWEVKDSGKCRSGQRRFWIAQ